jgi:hypothetical protein
VRTVKGASRLHSEWDAYSDKSLNSIQDLSQRKEPREAPRVTKLGHRNKRPSVTDKLFEDGECDILRVRPSLLRREKAQHVELRRRLSTFSGDYT